MPTPYKEGIYNTDPNDLIIKFLAKNLINLYSDDFSQYLFVKDDQNPYDIISNILKERVKRNLENFNVIDFFHIRHLRWEDVHYNGINRIEVDIKRYIDIGYHILPFCIRFNSKEDIFLFPVFIPHFIWLI